MENSLVNQIKQYISPELLSNLGVATNESQLGINTALESAIPALLLKMFNKGDGFLTGMFSQVQNIFRDANGDYDFKLNGLGGVLDGLLGNDKQNFLNTLSSHSSISSSSSNTVLTTALLGILGFFKNLSPNFDWSSIKGWISSNLGSIQGLLPAGFSSLGLLDTTADNLSTTQHNINENINEVVNHNEKDQYKTNESPYNDPNKDNSGNTLKYILIPLLLGCALIFFLYKSCNKKVETTNTTTENVDTINNQTTTTTTTTKVTKEVVVNDNLKLNAYADGIEDKLVNFLNTGDYKNMTEDQLKEIWFDFDNLNFEHGTANVLPESQQQLDNIAQILTAYPNVKIKIGGYTDKTGDEAVNKKISADRAAAVKKFLADKGLEKQIVGAEGYGSEFAKHPADASEELRVTDRKVSVSVRN